MIKSILNLIKRSRTIIISSHVNPDGDALGSCLAVSGLIRAMKQRCQIYNHSAHIDRYDFLPGVSGIRVLSQKPLKRPVCPDLWIVLDCPELHRTGSVHDWIKPKKIINIDHHASNRKFGDINWVNTAASATAEMLVALIEKAPVRWTARMAVPLYCGIVTDTGFFMQANTKPQTFQAASLLVNTGISPQQIAQKLCGNRTWNYHQLETCVRGTLTLHSKGRIGMMEIRHAWIKKYDGENTDTNDFFLVARQLKGVEVALLFWENSKRNIKVSFRSQRSYDVCRVAQMFGGGGHRQASGCTLNCSLREAKARVLAKICL